MTTRTLAPGHEIHWYRIEDVLGQGGFGVTYLAHDTNLDRQVAIKEYLPEMFAERGADDSVRALSALKSEGFRWGLDSFLAEARTLARFRHDNIVGVHSVFEDNNTAYMVMAYEQGDSLVALYNHGHCHDQGSLEQLFFPIFDGLGEVHRLGFVHRDIKPANIYIRENGSAVLLDFGAARSLIQQQSSEMTALVSQGYTPLEQYSASYGEQGPWTDIYALAATMYEGVTGNRPEESLRRSANRLGRRPDPVVALSSEGRAGFDTRFLDAVVAGLALHPGERPPDLDTWLEAFRGSPVATPTRRIEALDEFDSPGEPTRLRPPSSRAGRSGVSPPVSGEPPLKVPGTGATTPSVDDERTRVRAPAARPTDARAVSASETEVRKDLPLPVFGGFDDLDDMAPPTRVTRSAVPRVSSKSDAPRGGRKSGRALGAVALLAVLTVAGGGAWWWIAGPSSGEVIVRALDPALIDSLPVPTTPHEIVTREQQVLRNLDDMEQLALLYRQASTDGQLDGALVERVRALSEELGLLVAEWHPERHAGVIGRIERVAALLPANGAVLRASIAAADGRSDLEAMRALLDAGAVVEPAGASLIDRIGRLGLEDYRALAATPAWRNLMNTLATRALEKARVADFDGASLLVRAGLTLQPDQAFMRRLGEHLARVEGS